MAYQVFTSTPQQGTNADFRLWGLALSQAMDALAVFPKTSDTGQIDWSTVTAPSLANTMQGYEIRKFTNLTGNNIYVKIEFGSGAASSRPSLRLTFGNGSDGAGNITGNTYNTGIMGTAANAGTAMQNMVSSDGHYISFLLWISTGAASSQCCAIGAARTKDDSGNETNDGITIVWDCPGAGTGGTARGHVYLPKNGGGLAQATTGTNNVFQSSAPPTGTDLDGVDLAQNPLLTRNARSRNPSLIGLVVFTSDYGGAAKAGSVIECDLYNVTHYYMFPGEISSTTHQNNGNTNRTTLALRYE